MPIEIYRNSLGPCELIVIRATKIITLNGVNEKCKLIFTFLCSLKQFTLLDWHNFTLITYVKRCYLIDCYEWREMCWNISTLNTSRKHTFNEIILTINRRKSDFGHGIKFNPLRDNCKICNNILRDLKLSIIFLHQIYSL
jgi:hypothetical protein